MALAWTAVNKTVIGDKRRHSFTVAFDSSYPTGGEAYTNADLGFLAAPDTVTIEPSLGYVFEWDSANKKIKAYALSTAGGAAAASTDALSSKANVLSRESASAQTAPLREAHNTADLSALTAVPVVAIGTI